MYRIEFSGRCLNKLERIGDVFVIHEVFASLYDTVCKNPHVFPPMAPLANLYSFKTVMHSRGDLDIPALTFIFRIVEDDQIVHVCDVNYRNSDGSWHLKDEN